MTWAELKLEILQVMKLATNTIDMQDEGIAANVAKMPSFVNEALHTLVTENRPLIKSFDISLQNESNLLGDTIGFSTITYEGNDITFELSGVRAFCCEVDDAATIKIDRFETDDGAWANLVTQVIQPQSPRKYVKFKYVVQNGSGTNIRVTFSAYKQGNITFKYRYNIRNIGMFSGYYATIESIPDYAPFARYDLRVLALDFYRIKPGDVAWEQVNGEYEKSARCQFEGDHTLLVPYNNMGSYRVNYYAFPPSITATTPDNTALDVAHGYPTQDVMRLVSKYVASMLLRDDISEKDYCDLLLDEFDSKRMQLNATMDYGGMERMKNRSGW